MYGVVGLVARMCLLNQLWWEDEMLTPGTHCLLTDCCGGVLCMLVRMRCVRPSGVDARELRPPWPPAPKSCDPGVRPRPLPRPGALFMVGRGRVLLPRTVACVPGWALTAMCGVVTTWSEVSCSSSSGDSTIVPSSLNTTFFRLAMFTRIWGFLYRLVVGCSMSLSQVMCSLGESVVDVNLSIRFRHLVSSHIE